MTFTQDFFSSRRNYSDGNTRIGQTDRIWYDKLTHTLRISDGVTPGGIVISGGGALAQIQSDWTQTDTTRVDYIKNKPDVTTLTNVIADTSEPMGFVNRPDSVISFDTGSRTFSIVPAVTEYVIWTKGVRRTITASNSVSIPNTTGLYYIYFDPAGQLQYRTSFYDWPNDCMVAYIYWNAATQTAPFVADERHGVTLDWQTHEYLHRTRGAAFATGFVLSNYVVGGDGSSNSHIQVTLGSGTFFDEDLQVDIVATETPVANTWQQDLLNPARIPMFYHSGTGWVRDVPTDFPVKFGTVRPQYNLYSAGTWSTVDIDNNKFGVTFIVATNNINYPVIGIMGQSQRDNQIDAETLQFTSLDLTGFPVVELRVLYRLVFETKTNYTNSVRARLVSVWDLRTESAVGTAVVATNIDLSNVTSNIVPVTDVIYDLGTPERRWRDLYLSGNTLHLGSAVITSSGNTLLLPAGTAIQGGGSLAGGNVQGISDQVNTSTGYISIPQGTTIERPVTPPTGAMRYNSTTGFPEVYLSTGWVSFGQLPPTISTVTPASYNGEAGSVFVINGANFTADAVVKFVTNSGDEYTAAIVTYINSGQIAATTDRDFSVAQEPLDVKVLQASGQTTKLDCIDCGGLPTWNSVSGQLGGNILAQSAVSITASASDPDSNATVTYSLVSGALPGNLSLNSNTGVISGTGPVVSNDTTYNFTLRATDNAGNSSDRNFFVRVLAPTLTWQTASGSLGTDYTQRSSSFTVSATSQIAVTYSLVSGSLPTGHSLNTSSGVISGTASGVADYSNTVYTFTIRASNSFSTIDRQFSINIYSRYIGYRCSTAGEGGTCADTAPAGYVFNRKDFSSYGTPNGSCGAFTIGGCHSTSSGNWSPTLPAASYSIGANNTNWGDPCGGTAKRMYVQMSYGVF